MVKRHILTEPAHWLAHFKAVRGESSVPLLQKAIDLYDDLASSWLSKGLSIAGILLELGLDNEGIAAAIAYPALQAHEIHVDTITDQLGESSTRLLLDVLQMRSLHKLQQLSQRGTHQLENLRKMLLAMVADVRAVLLVLAERLWQLRDLKSHSLIEQQKFAQETLDVYAPLANRLGIGQLKWEMEDLCLRYLKPEEYKKIAKWLVTRREEREHYIAQVLDELKKLLTKNQLMHFQVMGRVKHIYSIYKKMQRKKNDLNDIYDISAVRVLVDTIQDCYAVLGIVHGEWQQIPKEFDDYIMHPKPNGYRSIHTAVLGPEKRTLEVQIRTFKMHQESELGVAAHWRYKEGGASQSDYEAKIAWLRQVMEWQKELSQSKDAHKPQQPAKDLFADRVYVFTPTGDIVDLPQGATPLDFAYHIHSEVGHRCRGAKVEGNIVPLTYLLQMGQRVEILTAKQAHPSRDWLNPHLNYLKTSRARAKVQHWFKAQDYLHNVSAGREVLEREIKRLALNVSFDWPAIVTKLGYKTEEDVLAALGAGSIRVAQILHGLQPTVSSTQLSALPKRELKSSDVQPITSANAVKIYGVKHLLTQMARCCKPLPGDAVIGFIARGKGVSIHRRDCRNILHLNSQQQQRLIDVEWGDKSVETYPVDLQLMIYDRPGILRDLTNLLAAEKIEVLQLNTQMRKTLSEIDIYLTIAIQNVLQLEKTLDHLQQVPNVLSVKRC